MLYREYLDWQEYYAVEPWGCELDDHRSAILISAILQSQGSKTTAQEVYDKFYDRDGSQQRREERAKARSAADLEARMDRYFDAWNEKQETGTDS